VDQALDPLVPGGVKQFILDLLTDAADRVGDGSLWLVLGSVILALVFGSRAVTALQKSLAAVSDSKERRPPLEMRLVAIGLTMGGGIALVLTSVMLLVGRTSVRALGNFTGLTLLDEVWLWLRVPVAAVGLFVFLLALYQFGPPKPLQRSWLAALIATGGSVLGSLGFGLYLSITPELGAAIGVLGGVAVALVWLYVGAMAILLGAMTVSYLDGRHAEPG
jgi:membrane protein